MKTKRLRFGTGSLIRGGARLALMVVLPLGFSATRAIAQSSQFQFDISVSEDLKVLQTNNPAIARQVIQSKSPHALQVARAMPWIQIDNKLTGAPNADITQLKIKVGDTTDTFDFAAEFQTSPGIQFNVVSPDMLPGQLKGDELLINFTSFGPGEFVRFMGGLLPKLNASTSLSDYRNALFGAGGDPTSVVNVTFTDPTFGSNTLSLNLESATLQQPGLQVATCCRKTPDAINVFGGSAEGAPLVPEPSSIVLFAFGSAGFLAWGWRRRRGG